jgi:hypothetical protein
LKINFFYVFMDHVGFQYPDELVAALNTNFENLKLLADAGQFAQNSSRYSLNVNIKAPKIFIPESKNSRIGFEADLGKLTVRNEFKIFQTSSDNLIKNRGIPIMDLLNVELTDFKLLKIEDYSSSHSQSLEILKQKKLKIEVVRNLSLNWFFDAPGMEITFNIPEIKMGIAKNDLEIFWRVLYGNLMKRFSIKAFRRSEPVRPTIVVTGSDGGLPGLSAGVLDESAMSDIDTESTLTCQNQPEDFDLMTVHLNLPLVELEIFEDKKHKCTLCHTKMAGMKALYRSLNNREMTFNLNICDLQLKDLRKNANIAFVRIPTAESAQLYLIQKQAEGADEDNLVYLTYNSFPVSDEKVKQIVSLKITSLQIIFILDFCMQIYDILVLSMPSEDSVSKQTVTIDEKRGNVTMGCNHR